MKIRIQNTRVNSVVSSIVYTEDWDRKELESLVSFGEPTVNTGGVFRVRGNGCECVDGDKTPGSEGSDDECSFTLPSSECGVKSGFPVMRQFPSDVYKDPEACAKAWSDEMVWRVSREVIAARQMFAIVSREEVYEI